MKEKYAKVGLDYDLIVDKYKDINYYEETVNAYFDDPFFSELKGMLIDEDYALAKDAIKGLYILGSELLLLPLYEKLLDIYEDLQYEEYSEVLDKYNDMYSEYQKIRGIFNA